ncbi:hypothetical protein QUB68_16555 [Microcoleus sp. A006_D1]|uniref:hypothetical protein n=1 Tax=Microcoleus sp. A006_D1 TaxID=3055267 RepID=UPI002FD5011C
MTHRPIALLSRRELTGGTPVPQWMLMGERPIALFDAPVDRTFEPQRTHRRDARATMDADGGTGDRSAS